MIIKAEIALVNEIIKAMIALDNEIIHTIVGPLRWATTIAVGDTGRKGGYTFFTT